MDESVRRAMGRWPDVPAVYGWVSLDQDGHWHLRGEPVTHSGLIEFIDRNYDCDEHGRWYFQNGPQRGYVSLAYTPWVLHREISGTLRTHTGRAIERVERAYVDEDGYLLLATEVGVGLVAADSIASVSEWLVDERGDPLEADAFGPALEHLRAGEPAGVYLRYGRATVGLDLVTRHDVPERFGFVPDPQPES